jgi:hypothetical protein
MEDLIIVQYFPLERRIGRFARTREDCESFNELFREEVNASDWEHRSIIMFLIDPEYKLQTTASIEHECYSTFKYFYESH